LELAARQGLTGLREDEGRWDGNEEGEGRVKEKGSTNQAGREGVAKELENVGKEHQSIRIARNVFSWIFVSDSLPDALAVGKDIIRRHTFISFQIGLLSPNSFVFAFFKYLMIFWSSL